MRPCAGVAMVLPLTAAIVHRLAEVWIGQMGSGKSRR